LHGTITGHITHRAPLIIRIFFLVHTPDGINLQCGIGQGSGKQYQNKINNQNNKGSGKQYQNKINN
jgi:hypothetical protein